jgi:hypothetical protein
MPERLPSRSRVPTRNTGESLPRELVDRGLSFALVDRDTASPSGVPKVMTMHRDKRLEFAKVASRICGLPFCLWRLNSMQWVVAVVWDLLVGALRWQGLALCLATALPVELRLCLPAVELICWTVRPGCVRRDSGC